MVWIKKQIVGYKLKAWTERYMILCGALYEENEGENCEGTVVTPTGNLPSLRYMASLYPSVA
jgi:hypothetical protein